MAYDEKLAESVRKILAGKKGITEKKMFGGVAFLVKGKMFCGVQKDELMVRVGPDNHNRAVSLKNVRVMVHGGKPVVGFLYVKKEGVKTKAGLQKWVNLTFGYVETIKKK